MARLWLYVTLCGAIVVPTTLWLRERDRASYEAGERAVEQRRADSVLKLLVGYERGLIGRVERDTVTLTKLVRSVITLRDTVLQQLHDTTLKRDTVTLLRYVYRTDSVIHSCRETVAGCLRLADNRLQQIHQLEFKLQAQPVQQSCTLGHVVFGGLGVGLGFALGKR